VCARDIFCQIEIVDSGGDGRFRDVRRQLERGGIEDGKLPIQQIDELGAILNIDRHALNAFVSTRAIENFRRAIREDYLIVSCRGQLFSDRSLYLARPMTTMCSIRPPELSVTLGQRNKRLT
jgi:hypothetical protein